MRTSAVAGIVFANSNDNLLNRLTSLRSMASVPFGGRYRLVDFTLSNLVNAGIANIGIITKENYHSLMDHVGSGVYWDLDRKNGGLYLLPPYATSEAKRYIGTVDALIGAQNYINRCGSDYIILYNSDIVANVDIPAAIEAHVANQADVTVVYHKGSSPKNHKETMLLELSDNNRIYKITFNTESQDDVNYDIGITVLSRELLKKLVAEGYENDARSLNRDIFAKATGQLKIYGFEHKGFVAVMDSMSSYYRANMDLLKSDIRKDLFDKKRPVFTKTRDDMPTRYGTKSNVKNSFIADGCIIDGTVKNSILFRGVRVEKGAVVENCILMQEAAVGEKANLKNVISDKNAVIGADMVLNGTENNCFFIEKNQIL